MKNIFIILSLILFLFSCKKEIFEPKYETNMTIDIQKNKFSDTTYFVNNFKITSGDDEVLEQGIIEVSYNGNILFNDYWQKIKSWEFYLSKRIQYQLTFKLYSNLKLIKSDTIEIDNRKFPDFIKISKITINYDLNSIPNKTTAFSNLIEINSAIYNDYFQGTMHYYVDYIPPYYNTYNFTNLYLRTKDENYNNGWMKYYITLAYPKAANNVFIGYEQFYFNLYIEDIIKNNQLNSNTTYSKTKETSNGGEMSIFYKPVYND